MPGIFGDMFDFNHDGRLDFFEQAAEITFFEEVILNEEKDEESDEGEEDPWERDSDFDDIDEYDEDFDDSEDW